MNHYTPMQDFSLLPGSRAGSVCHPLVYVSDEMAESIADCSQAKREVLVLRLRQIGEMIQTIADRLGIAAPVLVVPSPHGFAAYLEEADLGASIEGAVKQAIGIDPRHVAGIAPLMMQGLIPARRGLQLSERELYAVLAHEMGHLRYGIKKREVPDESHPEHEICIRHNYQAEMASDEAVMLAGASRQDMIGALLKVIGQQREQVFDSVRMAPTAEGYEAACKLRQQQSLGHWRGSASHPPLSLRDEALKAQETDGQTWQARQLAEKRTIVAEARLGRWRE